MIETDDLVILYSVEWQDRQLCENFLSFLAFEKRVADLWYGIQAVNTGFSVRRDRLRMDGGYHTVPCA